MAGDKRTADDITAEIAETRNRLAGTIDDLAYRAHPKTIAKRQVESTKSKFVNADGSPNVAVIGALAGGVVGVIALAVTLRQVLK